MVDAVVQRAYEDLLTVVRGELGESIYMTWFGRVRLVEFRRGVLSLGVPNAFVREWVEDHYRPLLTRAAEAVMGVEVGVEVRIDPELYREHREQVKDVDLRRVLDDVEEMPPASVDDFVTVPENDLAVRTVRHLVEADEPKFHTLLVVAPPGCGKSSLLHLAAHGGAKKGLFVRTRDYAKQFALSLKTKSIDRFRARHQTADVVCFDDIHELAGKKATQREFRRLVEALHEAGRRLVCASPVHPRQVERLDSGVRSVLLGGMVAEVEPCSPESLVRIAETAWSPRRMKISSKVVARLATQADGSPRVLRDMLLRTYAYSRMQDEIVTVDFVERHRDDLRGRPSEPEARFERLLDVVCDHFDVRREDLLSKRKMKSLLLPRGICVLVMRDSLQLTYKKIGRMLGGRSHTSAFLAYQKYDAARQSEDIATGLTEVMRRFTEPGS